MASTNRPKDVTQNAKLVCDMLTRDAPNDKDEILHPQEPEPEGRQRSGRARAEAVDAGTAPGNRPAGRDGALGRVMTGIGPYEFTRCPIGQHSLGKPAVPSYLRGLVCGAVRRRDLLGRYRHRGPLARGPIDALRGDGWGQLRVGRDS